MRISPGTTPAADQDVITARQYRHVGLADRPVVRLVQSTIAPAEDQAMDTIGFSLGRAADVGLGARQAVGFPAWVLANDPGNATHALKLAKDLEWVEKYAARSAHSSRSRVDTLATQLAGTLPHFLPTFHEQAGRIFINCGNIKQASAMFTKAREAEDFHGLPIDPDRVRDVYVEFSLVDALSTEVLNQYAKILASQLPPAEAYKQFLTFCIARLKADHGPHLGMPEDLRRLAKAAKLKRADADDDVLRRILNLVGIVKAGPKFWQSYREAATALASREPEVRAMLIRSVPLDKESHGDWLGTITDSGAADDVRRPADWVNRILKFRRQDYFDERCQPLHRVLELLADRLRADGVALTVSSGYKVNALDLIDFCLAEDIPLAGEARLPRLRTWVLDEGPGRRDLAAVGSSERYRDAVLHMVRNALGEPWAAKKIMSVPALRIPLERWLVDISERMQNGGGLAVLDEHLSDLHWVRSANLFVNVPQAGRTIAATDVAAALAHTLRGQAEELRTVDRAMAERLLGGEPVAEVLPEITHPELLTAVADTVEQASRIAHRTTGFRALVESLVPKVDSVPDKTLHEALRQIGGPRGMGSYPTEGSSTLIELVRQLGALPDTSPRPESPVRTTIIGWPELLPYPGMLAWYAASPATTAEHRDALIALLRTIAASGIADNGEHWRTISVLSPNDVVRDLPREPLITVDNGFLAMTWAGRSSDAGYEWLGVQYSATPELFALPEKWKLLSAQRYDSRFNRNFIEKFCAALETTGPVKSDPGHATELSNLSGMPHSVATLLLAGFPANDQAVAALDNKKHAASAEMRLNSLGRGTRYGLLQAGIPADISTLWTSGPDLSGMAEVWAAKFGRTHPVPDDVIVDAESLLTSEQPAQLVTDLLSPDLCDPAKLTDDRLVEAMAWLAYSLPGDSPLRDRLAKMSARVRDRLEPTLERACTQTGSGYLQDPTVSVPDLVELVAGKYDMAADVAVLYLQILALPEPTDTNVARWTGWKLPRLKAARAALAETDLVVSGKRARAGRGMFLPGGWDDCKKPLLPLETWKAPLCPLRTSNWPIMPVAELFRTAWQRVERGDAPAYEKLGVEQ